MIYSLNGTIILTEPNAVVIECGGVGYKCLTTMNTLRVLPKTGEKAMLYTHMIVREDAVELCGFADKSELACFRLLTGVSGVGAKVAIAILSVLTPEQLALAVSSGDSKAFTKASGVGKKLAEMFGSETVHILGNCHPLFGKKCCKGVLFALVVFVESLCMVIVDEKAFYLAEHFCFLLLTLIIGEIVCSYILMLIGRLPLCIECNCVYQVHYFSGRYLVKHLWYHLVSLVVYP